MNFKTYKQMKDYWLKDYENIESDTLGYLMLEDQFKDEYYADCYNYLIRNIENLNCFDLGEVVNSYSEFIAFDTLSNLYYEDTEEEYTKTLNYYVNNFKNYLINNIDTFK